MTRARRDLRWREQAARLVVEACWPRVHRWTECSRCDGNKSTRCLYCGGAGRRIVELSRYVQIGQHFDVALVRAYCKRLITEADALDLQREVFADWTRDRGMGPENREPGAFVSPAHHWRVDFNVAADTTVSGKWSMYVDDVAVACTYVGYSAQVNSVSHTLARLLLDAGVSARIPQYDSLIVSGKRVDATAPDGVQVRVRRLGQSEAPRGGWPGSLAREYVATQRARRRCTRRDCEGGVLARPLPALTEDDAGKLLSLVRQSDITAADARDIAVGACPECKQFDATRTPRTFANGGTLRRAAQRLLDTLDGRCPWAPDAEAQASECQECTDKNLWTVRTPDRRLVLGSYDSQAKARAHVAAVHGVITRDPWPCSACSGTGHNLRGTLPPLPAETVERLRAGFAEGEHMGASSEPWPASPPVALAPARVLRIDGLE